MIGILTAIEMEAASISAQMERAEAGCCGPLRCRHGYLGGQEVVLALCGIGKVNAALHTQMLIDQYGVDRLLHAGVAGAIAPAVKPMDLVIGRTLCYHDIPAEVQKLMAPSQLFYESSTALVEAAHAAAGSCHIGTIATGDQFISNAQAKQEIHLRTGALCVDMESAAVAQAAWLAKVPFVVLRCISDLANAEADTDFQQQGSQAAERAAQVICRMVLAM